MGVIDDLIATAQPRTAEVTVCARGDLVASHASAVAVLAEAEATEDSIESDAVTAAAAAVVAAEQEMDAARTPIKLHSIGGLWADLLRDNHPSREQRLQGYDNNPPAFQAAVVAACATEPEITLAQATEMRRVLDEGEWSRLIDAVALLNRAPMQTPKLAAATEILRANTPSSTTSPPEGSLEDVSLASGASQ